MDEISRRLIFPQLQDFVNNIPTQKTFCSRFVKDGRSWQYVAGGFHYFRTVPEYWSRTISTAKSAGVYFTEYWSRTISTAKSAGVFI